MRNYYEAASEWLYGPWLQVASGLTHCNGVQMQIALVAIAQQGRVCH
jgi:hypothetical protein